MLYLQVQLKLSSTNKKVSMRKTTSTNSINEEVMLARCGMSYTLSVIGEDGNLPSSSRC